MRLFRNSLFSLGLLLIERDFFLLTPLSFLWKGVVLTKNFLYRKSFFKSTRVKRAVISIGNLSVGGTGKTPLVHLLVSQFKERKVAILSRGYGGGDEVLLLKRRLPFAKIYQGKDRRVLAKRAVEEGAEVIFLDDGFQHRKLFRDLDLLIFSGRDPFGKDHLLPRGYLREPFQETMRADFFFISGQLEKSFPFPYVSLEYKPTRICNEREEEIPSLFREKVALFSAIGNPLSFRKTALSLGVDIVMEKWFIDHERPSERELNRFAHQAREKGATLLLCTEKDFVKKPSCHILPLFFVEISFEIVGNRVLWEKLIAKIEEKIDNSLSQ